MKLSKEPTDAHNIKPALLTHKTLSRSEFLKLRDLIESQIGVRMPDSKKIMLESRLHKRLRALSFDSFPEYCDYLFSKQGFHEELHHFFNIITTNKTDFFREPVHFERLVNDILPEYLSGNRRINRRVNFWSAGCATGEEAYSVAMVLDDFCVQQADFKFSIYATDISTEALKTAELGIYDQKKANPIPPHFRNKYLMRSKDRNKKLIRVTPKIRSLVRFQRLNLMGRAFFLPHEMDVIFCRNVIIYFERPTQEVLLKKFFKHLRVGGYLFLGHSETICGMSIPLETVLPTIYKKTGK
jgi:chemotaxis protein methyltransferase CheR